MFREGIYREQEPVDDWKAAPIQQYRPPLTVNFNREAWRPGTILNLTSHYAYALNLPQIGGAHIGHLLIRPSMDSMEDYFGTKIPETRNDMQTRLEFDGITYLDDLLPKEGHVMAFFLKPADSHSPSELLGVRRDSNGFWSYRKDADVMDCRAPFLPTQIDFANKPIKSISKADFGPYTKFLGFACIPYSGILYYRRIALPDEVMDPFCRAVPAIHKIGCP